MSESTRMGEGDFAVGSRIRTMHRYGFRQGQWALIVANLEYAGQECVVVLFPDGKTDLWVKDDPEGGYEFQ